MTEYSEFVDFMGDSADDDPFFLNDNQVKIYKSLPVQQVIAMSNMDIEYPQVRGGDLKAAKLMPLFSNYDNPEDRYITHHYLGKQYPLSIENAFAAQYLHSMFNAKWLEKKIRPKSEKYLKEQIDETLPGLGQGFEEILTLHRQIELIKIGNGIRNGKTDIDRFSERNQSEQLAYEIRFIQDYLEISSKPRGVKLLLKLADAEFARIKNGEEFLGDELLDLFAMVMSSSPEDITRRQVTHMYSYTGGSRVEEDNSADLAFRFQDEMSEKKYNPPHNTLAEVLVYNLAKLGGKETIVEGDEFLRIDELFLTQQQAVDLITDIEDTLGSKRQTTQP